MISRKIEDFSTKAAHYFESRSLYDHPITGELTAYAIMPSTPGFVGRRNIYHQVVVHEFAHAIADPIASQWLSGNFRFWAMANETFRRDRMHEIYTTLRMVAYEYVTRAFEILYFVDNGNQNIAALFQQQINRGFANIVEVFDMLMRHIGRYEMVQE